MRAKFHRPVATPTHLCARGISASLHVIACIEDPPLTRRILGHVQLRATVAGITARRAVFAALQNTKAFINPWTCSV